MVECRAEAASIRGEVTTGDETPAKHVLGLRYAINGVGISENSTSDVR